MAVYLVNAWLLLLDGGASERKCDLVRVYAAEHLPHIHSAAQAILAADAPRCRQETPFYKTF